MAASIVFCNAVAVATVLLLTTECPCGEGADDILEDLCSDIIRTSTHMNIPHIEQVTSRKRNPKVLPNIAASLLTSKFTN